MIIQKKFTKKIKGRNRSFYECKCECGNIIDIRVDSYKNGTKSCGCLQKKQCSELGKKGLSKTHGFTGNIFYKKYAGIKTRCSNKNETHYKNYGGRGIKCEWKTFEEFKNDMYESYLEHKKNNGEKNTTIERINVNGNYSKKNCKWATKKEQSRNRRNNIIFEGKCIMEWSEELGINSGTIYTRISRGKDIKSALNIN